MRKNKTEQYLRDRADSHVPDLKDHIKESHAYQSFMREASTNKDPKFFQKRFTPAFASVLAVLLIGLFVILPLSPSGPASGPAGTTTSIQIEFNPSFAINIDEEDTIIDLSAHNDDAQTMIDETGNLEGDSLDDGLDKLFEKAVELDFLREDTAEILYTVNSDDNARAEKLAGDLENKLPSVARANGINNAQAMRSVNGPPGQDELNEARDHNIGFMKMRLIKNILENTDGYAFETLKEESVSSLKTIINEEDIEAHGPPFKDDTIPGPPGRDNDSQMPGGGRP